jgi:hypothetical protein
MVDVPRSPGIFMSKASPIVGTLAMNSVKCPRCLRIWYSEDDAEGSDRLCSGCLSDLRAAGRDPDRQYGIGYLRKKKERVGLNYFLIYVLVLCGIDLILIGLTMIFPYPFGPVLLVYGLVLFGLGSTAFRWMTWGSWWIWSWQYHEIDWDSAKWPAMAAAAGLVCLVASGRLFI